MSEVLRFEAFSSMVEPEFWAGLAHHKLHSARLDTARATVQGDFAGGRRHAARTSAAAAGTQRFAVPARLRVSQGTWGEARGNGAASDAQQPGTAVSVSGHLYNTNTIEEFKKHDKGSLLRCVGAEILDAIRSGEATRTPALLWPFLLLSFADLKRYRFYHWFAFPAVTADPPDLVVEAPMPLGELVAAGRDLGQLLAAYLAFSCQHERAAGAFVVRYCADARDGSSWELCPLSEWDSVFGSGRGEAMLGFVDPSSHSSRPGWPLRNLLAWLRYCHPEVARVRVLCFRDAVLALGGPREHASLAQQCESIVLSVEVTAAADLKAECQISGWERNDKQQLVPRMVNLSSTMDPVRLAESALDLNLQLMRWRLAPSIDLARIAGTRALLVGAGTLGAYVARALLAWGVRKITFVDNGRVSFSNPARQPLYEFADSLDGGKPKAEAAAVSLRRIFPNVDAQGVNMSIPMPGHAISPAEVESTRAAVEQLDELVTGHDTVFLLTDSRESRWLPTVLGTLRRKVVVCVALGFDSFVAMRHGIYAPDDDFGAAAQAAPDGRHPRLGCYFCNDVVAPTDSLTDRTLDQQCTVTRPGLAPIASGTAVELLATILQHPRGGLAPPPAAQSLPGQPAGVDDDDEDSVFGAPAHQIRGYLAGFRQHAIVGQASDMCTACSPSVIDAYRQHGFEFLLRAFNNVLVDEATPHCAVEVADGGANVPADYSYLETLTGLAALHRQTDRVLEDIEWSESEGSDGVFEEL
ncbi:Autophagy protein 7 [Coemansia biformis]|uniref:Ubiquitin-like modifier-activating enzyme ATG7 n=1 Tax=Coemansia biformis TaxID=1286918 RepID=A0A9W8CXN7_9FUNG|nr:Autophagy protein 7 [Coemansia biformis]